MKLDRLRGRKRNAYVMRKGNVHKGNTMLVRWLPCAPKHPNIDPYVPALYVGTYASTKLDKSAVKRNRMRRRCREALRKKVLHMQPFGPVQLLLTPRKRALDCSWEEIVQDVEDILRKISSF